MQVSAAATRASPTPAPTIPLGQACPRKHAARFAKRATPDGSPLAPDAPLAPALPPSVSADRRTRCVQGRDKQPLEVKAERVKELCACPTVLDARRPQAVGGGERERKQRTQCTRIRIALRNTAARGAGAGASASAPGRPRAPRVRPRDARSTRAQALRSKSRAVSYPRVRCKGARRRARWECTRRRRDAVHAGLRTASTRERQSRASALHQRGKAGAVHGGPRMRIECDGWRARPTGAPPTEPRAKVQRGRAPPCKVQAGVQLCREMQVRVHGSRAHYTAARSAGTEGAAKVQIARRENLIRALPLFARAASGAWCGRTVRARTDGSVVPRPAGTIAHAAQPLGRHAECSLASRRSKEAMQDDESEKRKKARGNEKDAPSPGSRSSINGRRRAREWRSVTCVPVSRAARSVANSAGCNGMEGKSGGRGDGSKRREIRKTKEARREGSERRDGEADSEEKAREGKGSKRRRRGTGRRAEEAAKGKKSGKKVMKTKRRQGRNRREKRRTDPQCAPDDDEHAARFSRAMPSGFVPPHPSFASAAAFHSPPSGRPILALRIDGGSREPRAYTTYAKANTERARERYGVHAEGEDMRIHDDVSREVVPRRVGVKTREHCEESVRSASPAVSAHHEREGAHAQVPSTIHHGRHLSRPAACAPAWHDNAQRQRRHSQLVDLRLTSIRNPQDDYCPQRRRCRRGQRGSWGVARRDSSERSNRGNTLSGISATCEPGYSADGCMLPNSDLAGLWRDGERRRATRGWSAALSGIQEWKADLCCLVDSDDERLTRAGDVCASDLPAFGANAVITRSGSGTGAQFRALLWDKLTQKILTSGLAVVVGSGLRAAFRSLKRLTRYKCDRNQHSKQDGYSDEHYDE
ncbi:hypothetical protein FB451DRAFT_1170469 [Mycena latifolia]|nr:hypothetical protein FB451DRAFT_1170469 [Mycena latifolia]